jgi:polysaccharide biosynthesis/export protein
MRQAGSQAKGGDGMRQNRSQILAIRCLAAALAWCLVQQVLLVAVAQETESRIATQAPGTAATTKSGAADDRRSPALTGVRRPLYRLRTSDVLEIHFTFAPEFDQTVTVQPDGFIPLKGLQEVYARDMTSQTLQETLRQGYAGIMHDPEIRVVLKDFDRPYFIAGGQVTHPGKYDLREDLTVTESVALAGGFNDQAKHSQVLLFRHVSDDIIESRVLNLKHMLNSKNLTEDVYLKPGDFIFVPQNGISKIRRYLPASNLSLYSTPTQF